MRILRDGGVVGVGTYLEYLASLSEILGSVGACIQVATYVGRFIIR